MRLLFSPYICSLVAVAVCSVICLTRARAAQESANALRGICTVRLTSLQLTLRQDSGLSIFVSASNTARPLQALGCCYLFSLYSPHSELANTLQRNSSGECKAHFSVLPCPQGCSLYSPAACIISSYLQRALLLQFAQLLQLFSNGRVILTLVIPSQRVAVVLFPLSTFH